MTQHYLSKFTFPKLQRVKSNQTLPLTSNELSDWIADLPMLDNKVLTSEISTYLGKINSLEIKDDERFELLELLRPIVERIIAEMIRDTRGHEVEISPENSARQHNAGIILRTMAVGYQRLLVDVAAPSWFGASKKDKALLVERVLFYSGEQLRLAYMLCAFEDEAVWQALNISYHYAIIEKIDKKIIKDSFAYPSGKGSLDLVYKRIVLLAMVVPYGLRDAEVDQIYNGLSVVVELLEIAPIMEQTDDVMHMIDLKQSYPPSLQTTLASKGSYYRIGNGDLHRKLTHYLLTGERPKEAHEKGLSIAVLTHLCHHLEPIKRRVTSRVSRGDQHINAVVGLENIHLLFEQINKVEIEEETIVREEIEKGELTFSKSDAPPTQAVAEQQVQIDEPIEVPIYQFYLQDESETGARLRCREVQGAGLYLGRFLLLKSIVTEEWILANIRWIRLKNEQEFLLGVELLCSEIESIEIKAIGKNAETVKVLLLKNEGQNSLLLPKAQYQQGDTIVCLGQEQETMLILNQPIWENNGTAQFYYSEKPNVDPDPDPEQSPESKSATDLRDIT